MHLVAGAASADSKTASSVHLVAWKGCPWEKGNAGRCRNPRKLSPRTGRKESEESLRASSVGEYGTCSQLAFQIFNFRNIQNVVIGPDQGSQCTSKSPSDPIVKLIYLYLSDIAGHKADAVSVLKNR